MATFSYCKILCYLQFALSFTESRSRLMLSPSGVARVCPSGELTITCTTDRSFLEWSITPSFTIPGIPYRTRLVSASSHNGHVDPLVLNMISFDFSAHTSLTNGSSVSLVSVLSVTSVSDILNNTRVNCTDIGASLAETNTSTVTVHVIGLTDLAVYSNSLEIEVKLEVLNFGIDDITVSLSWTQQESSVLYNVSIVPQATVVFIQGSERIITNQLTVSYNIQYNMSIVGTLCGHNISSTAVALNYVKCESLLHQLGTDIRVNGYRGPAVEGTTAILECSSPNLVHVGPNTTTCLGNGEWEPDPRTVNCIADCGVPLVDSSLNLTYNSTLVGSEVLVWCDEFVVTALCLRNGSWSPQLTNSPCDITLPMTTESDQTLVSYTVIIIITVVISVIVLFTLSFMATVCTCLCCKYKWSSKASSDGKTVDTQSNQPTQLMPVYETVMECTRVDLEMTENVAYAPVRSLSRET